MREPSVNKKLTIIDHLADLRKRLIIIVAVNLVAAFALLQFVEPISQYLLVLNPGMQLVYLDPSELFIVYVQLALLAAVILCSPITIYQIWAFVGKALYRKEKAYVLLSLFFGLFFFVGGVLFAYFIAVPMTLDFFVQIKNAAVSPMISVQSYFSFINTILFSFGLIFEMPVLSFLLSKLGILKPNFLTKKRGLLIVLIFIVAAIITPPDVISQVLLGVPMVLLMELSILVCKAVYRTKQSKEADEEAQEDALSA